MGKPKGLRGQKSQAQQAAQRALAEKERRQKLRGDPAAAAAEAARAKERRRKLRGDPAAAAAEAARAKDRRRKSRGDPSAAAAEAARAKDRRRKSGGDPAAAAAEAARAKSRRRKSQEDPAAAAGNAARCKDRRRKSQGDPAAATAEADRAAKRRAVLPVFQDAELEIPHAKDVRASVACRTTAVCGTEGTWTVVNGIEGQTLRPPCFGALDDAASLQMILEMHGSLENVAFHTCSACWKAWHSCPDARFSAAFNGGRCWFDVRDSAVLGEWCYAASESSTWPQKEHLEHIRDLPIECVCGAQSWLVGLGPLCDACGGSQRLRQMSVCSQCATSSADGSLLQNRQAFAVDPVERIGTAPHLRYRERWEEIAEQSTDRGLSRSDETPPAVVPSPASERILGRPVWEFAGAVAALSDFEEMVLARVHPLVQVYSIPRTGELAYVGHVCNFRQNVRRFMKDLPVRPAEMPIVLIQPRRPPGAADQRPRAPSPVDVQKLRAAFAWLREFNVWYQDAHWDEEAAAAWRDETEDLPVQEEDLDAHQQLSRGTFLAWMQTSQAAEETGSIGFAIGRVLRVELSARLEQSRDAGGSLSGSHADCRLWGEFLRAAAEACECPALRAGTALSTVELAAVMQLLGIITVSGLELGEGARQAVRDMAASEWPAELAAAGAEIMTVSCSIAEGRGASVEVASLEAAPADGDEIDRTVAVSELSRAMEQPQARTGTCSRETGCKQQVPRLPPPAISQEPLREDTIGYIPQAFPKLFPCGTGDYHDPRDLKGPSGKVDFITWVRMAAPPDSASGCAYWMRCLQLGSRNDCSSA